MQRIRPRLTYANVMASIALFLVLAGATAFAAHKLAKGSVGTRQLKANAVTTAKLKHDAVRTNKIARNAVTAAKIRAGAISTAKLGKGAVTGEKIAANTVTGANIDAPSTPFGQVVARLRTSARLSFEAAEPLYPLGSYTQAEGEDDQYLAGIEVSFAASCEAPRSAKAVLVTEVSNLSELTTANRLGAGTVEDQGSGAVTRRLEFGPTEEGGPPMARLAPSVATNRNLAVQLTSASCASGEGVSASGGQLDVIGTR